MHLAYTQTFEMEGAGVYSWLFLKGTKMPKNADGGCKIKECKVIFWPNLHDF